ncbi:hypothetical protein AB6A40_008720 [Gnathostoma spinigerum]|uniref:Uncharacterized protein n=1 Tax=Gnathostoma spinigerum TaxID=75299 RepID=A0ABD6EQ93_9BILA
MGDPPPPQDAGASNPTPTIPVPSNAAQSSVQPETNLNSVKDEQKNDGANDPQKALPVGGDAELQNRYTRGQMRCMIVSGSAFVVCSILTVTFMTLLIKRVPVFF